MKRCCGTQRKHFRLGLRDTGYAEGAQRSFRMVVSERDYDQVLRLDRWIGQASNQLFIGRRFSVLAVCTENLIPY